MRYYLTIILSLLAAISTSLAAPPSFIGLSGPWIVVGGGGVFDDFNRGDGGLGSNWVTIRNHTAPVIISERAGSNVSSTRFGAYWSADTFNDNQCSTIVAQGVYAATEIAPGVRIQAAASTEGGYFVKAKPSSIRIAKLVNGSWTDTIGTSIAHTLANGDVIKLCVSGSTLTSYLNGSIIDTVTGQTDHSTGQPGFFVYGGSSRLDDWSGENL